MFEYAEHLKEKQRKEQKEREQYFWTIQPDNGTTGDNAKKYYRQHGYIQEVKINEKNINRISNSYREWSCYTNRTVINITT